ncbi:putative membrane protein YkoI [Marisediminicola sp. UYEF4]|uniref:PepSY domain-containing protein n=1 Tax=Marisediminicola sp. UYEF4 TaxID=1756384 RepID=UPI0033996135
MKFPIKRTVTAGILISGLALGGAGVAMASTNSPATSGGSNSTTEGGSQEQDPTYVGSVPAPQDTEAEGTEAEGTEAEGTEAEGKDNEASEAEESMSLQPLATTTPEQATAAALAAVPGTAGAVELDNENGYVVYSVEVTAADGSSVDVKVDAGNGSVLAQDTDDDTATNDD